MDNSQLQKLVEKISITDFGLKFNHEARFNSRLRTTGGRYLLASHAIEINPKIEKNYSEKILVGVIRHELCHYHLHLRHRGYKHQNKDFKELLQKVGGSRYSPATLNSKIKVVYQCQRCFKEYPRQRRINVNKYCCSQCHGPLKMIENNFEK